MKTRIKTTLVIMLMVALCLALSACGKQTVDLTDYVEVSFSGHNGYGNAYASLDEEELLYTLMGESENDEDEDSLLNTLYLIEKIEVEAASSGSLSNGDKVTVTVTYPDSLGDKLDANFTPKSGSSWEVIVEGLNEIETVDLFENVDVIFSGFDGYGTAEVDCGNNHRFNFELSAEDNLSNGDTVILSLDIGSEKNDPEYFMKNYGFIPAATSKEYIVSGLTIPGEVDLFEDIDVTVEGYSPYLNIAIWGKYENDGISYELVDDSNGSYAIGDTITIQAVADSWWSDADLAETCLENLGALPISDTYTYTIGTDTPYYITDAGQLTDSVMDHLISEAKDIFDSAPKDRDFTLQGVSYYGCYLQTAKHSDCWGEYNRLFIVQEVSYVLYGEIGTHYNVVQFNNVVIEADGSCHFGQYWNLYGWDWGGIGLEDLYEFVREYITSQAADYRNTEILAGN